MLYSCLTWRVSRLDCSFNDGSAPLFKVVGCSTTRCDTRSVRSGVNPPKARKCLTTPHSRDWLLSIGACMAHPPLLRTKKRSTHETSFCRGLYSFFYDLKLSHTLHDTAQFQDFDSQSGFPPPLVFWFPSTRGRMKFLIAPIGRRESISYHRINYVDFVAVSHPREREKYSRCTKFRSRLCTYLEFKWEM